MEKALGFLERIFNSKDIGCDKFFPGNGCKLPVIPGHYMAPYLKDDDHSEFTFPIEIPRALQVLSGKYRMQAQLIADDGRELCWTWTADIKFKHS